MSEVIDEQIIELFKTKGINEIKDYHSNVHSESVDLRYQLDKQLLTNYNDILIVTQSIQDIVTEMKIGDDKLRELCFNDDVYHLKKLGEFHPDNIISKDLNDIIDIDYDINQENESLLIASITEWTCNVNLFCQAYNYDNNINNNINHNSENIWQLLNESLKKLKKGTILNDIQKNEILFKSLKSSCNQLASIIKIQESDEDKEIEIIDIENENDENVNDLIMSPHQYIQFYNIISDNSLPIENRDNILNEIINKLLSSIHIIQILLSSNSNEVKDFIKLDKFSKKLIELTRDDINAGLQRLSRLIEEANIQDNDEDKINDKILYPILKHDDNDDNTNNNQMNDNNSNNIESIVRRAQQISKGLGNDTRMRAHGQSQMIKELLDREIKISTSTNNNTNDNIKSKYDSISTTKLNELYKQAIKKTETEEKEISEKLISSSTDTTDMNTLVKNTLEQFETKRYISLLETGITTLTEI